MMTIESWDLLAEIDFEKKTPIRRHDDTMKAAMVDIAKPQLTTFDWAP
jgi:hypothetical protein